MFSLWSLLGGHVIFPGLHNEKSEEKERERDKGGITKQRSQESETERWKISKAKFKSSSEEYGFYICSKDYPQPCPVPTPSSFLERCMQWRPVNVAFDSDTEQWKLSHSIQNAIPHYFLHKKKIIQLYTYITYFTVTIKTYLSIHQRVTGLLHLSKCIILLFLSSLRKISLKTVFIAGVGIYITLGYEFWIGNTLLFGVGWYWTFLEKSPKGK